MKPLSKNAPILMFSTEYPPQIWGGLGTHAAQLTQELSAAETHGMLVTLPAPSHEPEYEKQHSFTIYRPQLQNEEYDNSYEWMVNINLTWIKAIQSLQPSFCLVHAHDWLTAGAAIYAKRMYRIPLIATIHSLETGRKKVLKTPAEKMIHEMEKKLIKEADELIVCSNFMREEILFEEADSKKISVIHNGAVPFQKNSLGNPFISPYIFSMGRFVPEKGFEDLITAFSKIKSEHPALKLIIAGEGPGKEKYEKLAESLEVHQDVIFPGFIKGDELNRYIQYAAVACIPSRYEPFGLAALEFMAAGKPIVVSDAGGLPEMIVHNESGMIYKSSRIDDLKRSIQELLNHPEKAAVLGMKALNESKKYSWSSAANKTINLYKKSLQHM
ncbi:glycosyltransferase family 4 protein [Metabacillus sp. KIGAM252]|uniref:Glycosyltransferase family 4 protein n=1 Tax=Metabacillus flavus TaxID=2823519 RepID=A0ABS5LGR4_9BACI|nr:glycosyltransferase family 4 protein [Metabacillus flavus]MBS2969693.1 glycosyltransferase family 4 protein [Metabacillus flavus]